MTFTALQFPLDKDPSQLSFWPDNDELAIAGESFFDQCLTFDGGEAATFGGEVLNDPPSPSVLLASLQNESASSDLLHLPRDGSQLGSSITITSRSITMPLQSDSVDQIISSPVAAPPLAGDPILSKGSISDSELLHLEGISLRSSPPRGTVTAPSSPPLAISTPLIPDKHSRLVETGYATIRRAAYRPRLPQQGHYPSLGTTDLDAFLADPRCRLNMSDMNYDEFPDPIVGTKQESMGSPGLPPSPPLLSQGLGKHFVSGHLDDPFCDDMSGMSATSRSKGQGLGTPTTTPGTNNMALFHGQAMPSTNANINSVRRPHRAQRSTSSAEWPMEGLLTDAKYNEDANMWPSIPPSAIYLASNGGGSMTSPCCWDHHHPIDAGSVHGNVAHNMAMHGQQADLPYEFTTRADVSGLMIQMPQPRAPQASVLSSNLNEQQALANYHVQGTLGTVHPHRPQQPPQQQHSKGYGYAERRPRPRAPSSGARHHGAQTSPRKLHHSTSLGCLREEAQSSAAAAATARHGSGQHQHQANGHGQERRHHRRSSSLTMRKQRSFTRRSGGGGGGGEPRTPSTSTQDSNGGGGGGGGGGGEEAGFGGRGFVNFTPNDKNKLMAGVAPSGSSKTKLRREKEALEKSRLISEMALKVADGDVNPGVLKRLMGVAD